MFHMNVLLDKIKYHRLYSTLKHCFMAAVMIGTYGLSSE